MLSLTRLFSSDSHVLEPGDLWTSRVPAAHRDTAPRIVAREDGDRFVFEDRKASPVGAEWAAGEGANQSGKGRYADAPPGGWDPRVRIGDQDRDGIAAEILYPTLGLKLWDGAPAEHRTLHFDVFNEWIAEFCATHPDRFHGVAMIDVDDVDTACRQIDEARRLGLAGLMLPAAQKPHYYEDRFDPIWERASDYRMPITFHVGTGEKWVVYRGRGAAGMNIWRTMANIQETLVLLVFSGAYERYPGLRTGFVEGGISWVPSLLDQLDHIHRQHQWIRPRLERLPSEYWRAHCFATFERSKVGLSMRHRMGIESVMWANDFPHAESTWPNSHAVIEEDMGQLPQDEVDQIVYRNVEAAYGLTPAATPAAAR